MLKLRKPKATALKKTGVHFYCQEMTMDVGHQMMRVTVQPRLVGSIAEPSAVYNSGMDFDKAVKRMKNGSDAAFNNFMKALSVESPDDSGRLFGPSN